MFFPFGRGGFPGGGYGRFYPLFRGVVLVILRAVFVINIDLIFGSAIMGNGDVMGRFASWVKEDEKENDG